MASAKSGKSMKSMKTLSDPASGSGSEKTVNSDDPGAGDPSGRGDSPLGSRKSAARDKPDKKSTRGSADRDTRKSRDKSDPPKASSKDPPKASSKDPPKASSKDPPAATSKDPPTAPPAPAGGSTVSMGTTSSKGSGGKESSFLACCKAYWWLVAGLGLALAGGLIYLIYFSDYFSGDGCKTCTDGTCKTCTGNTAQTPNAEVGGGTPQNAPQANGNTLAKTGTTASGQVGPGAAIPKPAPKTGATTAQVGVDIGGACGASGQQCKKGKCNNENKCVWVALGQTCDREKTSECQHLCEWDFIAQEHTCRAALNGKCSKDEGVQDYCQEHTVCSKVNGDSHLCKAVIGGHCTDGNDCYHKLYALTHDENSFWKKDTDLPDAQVKAPDGSNAAAQTWCHEATKTCQVFAAHSKWFPKNDGSMIMCHAKLHGRIVIVDENNKANNLCKATDGQPCHDPRGRPMPSWCNSGICEKKDPSSDKNEHVCKDAMTTAGSVLKHETSGGANIQLGERANAWPFTNTSLAETAAHAGKTSNNLRGNRGKRTRSPDAFALQVDSF